MKESSGGIIHAPRAALRAAGTHEGEQQAGFYFGVRRLSATATALSEDRDCPGVVRQLEAVSRFTCHRSPKRRVADDAGREVHQQGPLAAVWWGEPARAYARPTEHTAEAPLHVGGERSRPAAPGRPPRGSIAWSSRATTTTRGARVLPTSGRDAATALFGWAESRFAGQRRPKSFACFVLSCGNGIDVCPCLPVMENAFDTSPDPSPRPRRSGRISLRALCFLVADWLSGGSCISRLKTNG